MFNKLNLNNHLFCSFMAYQIGLRKINYNITCCKVETGNILFEFVWYWYLIKHKYQTKNIEIPMNLTFNCIKIDYILVRHVYFIFIFCCLL